MTKIAAVWYNEQLQLTRRFELKYPRILTCRFDMSLVRQDGRAIELQRVRPRWFLERSELQRKIASSRTLCFD
jgi:hypothetical protein